MTNMVLDSENGTSTRMLESLGWRLRFINSSKTYPREEKYTLVDQTKRALNSIILNIAEGANKGTDKETKLYILRAATSLDEVIACLDCALDNRYIAKREHEDFLQKAESLAKRLKKFAVKLSNNHMLNSQLVKSQIVFAGIVPHPPIIIPTIGQPADLKLVKKTIEGMEKLAEKFAKTKPETVIIISPHGPVDFNNFTITNSPTLAGHFYNFGDFQTELIFQNDEKLIEAIKKESQKQKIPLRLANIKELDHGVLVPLYYLAKKYPNFKVVPLTYSYLDLKTHFQFGQVLESIINNQKTKVGFVASGDLSHRLSPDAPAGYSPRGKEFDQKLIELLKKKDIEGILNMDPNLVEEVGECGYRSIIILLGVLEGLDWQPEILSYEGPFGVGYLVANFRL
jgi:AmmeMemoRadiSam system protein B